MPRVNVDASLWTDPRARRLAAVFGWTMRELVGTLCAVWNEAYSRRTAILAGIDIDTAAETKGFAEAMADPAIGLASNKATNGKVLTKTASLLGGQYRLMGVSKRIQYLEEQRERGSKGGKAKANSEVAKAKQTLSKALANRYQSPSLPLALDLDPALPPDLALAPDKPLDQEQDYEASVGLVVQELAAQLLQAIRSHSPRFASNNLGAWANDIRLLVGKDGYSREDVERVINFVHRTERGTWWRKRICGGRPLRVNFGALLIDLNNPSGAPAMRRGNAARELLDEANQLEHARRVAEGKKTTK
jgi:hypothetical protein